MNCKIVHPKFSSDLELQLGKRYIKKIINKKIEEPGLNPILLCLYWAIRIIFLNGMFIGRYKQSYGPNFSNCNDRHYMYVFKQKHWRLQCIRLFFKCNFILCAFCNRPMSLLMITSCSIGMKILGKLTPKTQLAHREASNSITQQAAFGSIFQTSLGNSASHVASQHMMTSYHVFTWRTETNLRTSSLMQVRHPKDVTQ